MRQFGLIGFPLGHSFSGKYFTEKFEREGITDAQYALYPLEDIKELPAYLAARPGLCGLNVTIPYKEAVIPYLDSLDETAAQIGAVNCIDLRRGRRRGYNTDVIGFEQSLRQSAPPAFLGQDCMAFVLGTGGASKAVVYVLKKLGIAHQLVSRTPRGTESMDYKGLEATLLDRKKMPQNRQLIVNCTPLGTYPHTEACPPLAFDHLGPEYFVFDLIYNPAETVLLRETRLRGGHTQNGLDMLTGQAEAAWKIWNTTAEAQENSF